MEKMLECGKIINTHGVRGEVRIDPWCDGDAFFDQVECVLVGGEPFRIVSHRPHKQFVLAVLEGVDTLEKAEALKNKVLSVPRDQVVLPEGKILYSDLFGFSVFDLRVGREIGVLEDVRELPAGFLYVIRQGQQEILIPAVPAFEAGCDMEARRMDVRTIEGMLPNEN